MTLSPAQAKLAAEALGEGCAGGEVEETVAVAWVEVGVDLKHEAAEIGLRGGHIALVGGAWQRRGRDFGEGVEQFFYAKVVYRRAKKHWRQVGI